MPSTYLNQGRWKDEPLKLKAHPQTRQTENDRVREAARKILLVQMRRKQLNQSDYDNFINIMQLVSEQYGKNPSEGLISLYWNGLKNYEFSAVQDAIGRHLGNTDTGQFMPKIADIIRMLQGSSQDAAFSAWSKVDKAVRQVGPYDSVVFDDPLIHKVLHDMGGWMGICGKDDEA